MIRSQALAIASALLLLFVTGCNQEEQAEEIVPSPVAIKKKPKPGASPAKGAASPGAAQAPAAVKSPKKQAQAQPSPKAAAAPAKDPAAKTTGVKDTLTKLNGYLPAAVKALQANDVDTAKQYVQGFSDNWGQKIIQYTVKTKSKASYDKITASVTQVNNLMKADAPDNAKAIAAIQSLSQAVNEYTKSP
jgi:hypothetical protein